MPGVEVGSALNDDAEIAPGIRLGIDQEFELLQGESERRIPTDSTGNDEKNGEPDGALVGLCVSHIRIIARSTPRQTDNACDNLSKPVEPRSNMAPKKAYRAPLRATKQQPLQCRIASSEALR